MPEFTRDDLWKLARKRADSCRDTAVRAGIRGHLDTTLVYLTATEVAERLSITRPELYRLVADGEIIAHRWGSSLLFDPEDMRRHAEEC